MALFHDSAIVGASGNQGGAGEYQISRSLRFNSSDSAYLSRTPASAGNRQTWTVSLWVKRAALGSAQYLWEGGSPDGTTTRLALRFNSSDQLNILNLGVLRTTTQVFRDPSAWYHIVVAVDTPQATAANRLKIYVNGSQVTDFASSSDLSQNADTGWNMAAAHSIGRTHIDSGFYFNGYIADFHNIDGQALAPSSFAETNATTGQWVPKAYTGAYGTNGFRLAFADNSNNTATTLGKDTSGNGNNWTPNNLSVTAGAGNDSLVDTPTSYGTDTGAGGEVRGNYATWNPISGYSTTLTNGNLDYTTGTADNPVTATWSLPTSGKWYWEVTPTTINEAMIGVQTRSNLAYLGPKTVYYRQGGASNGIYIEGATNAYNASSYTNNDVIGVAFDADNSQIRWYKNNVQQGGPYNLTSVADLTPIVIQASATNSNSGSANFGQRPFAYTAPSGFKALCDTNLPAPVVAKPSESFQTVLWTGDNTSNRTITTGLRSGFVWIKNRSASGPTHILHDVVRGAGQTLYTSSTSAEVNNGTAYVQQFNATNFLLGAPDSASNASGNSYVGWVWDPGASTVTNTSGSISSQVRANASAGFSIVTYTGNGSTGATVGHGLGVAPGFVIIKDRGAAFDWRVWTTSFGTGNALSLNSTAATSSNSPVMQAAPSSTVMSLLGSGYSVNNSGNTYVAYCFAPVAGYSAFGSYTGNGSTDGPFVYTGFRPRWVMIKNLSANSLSAYGSWKIIDASRDSYNGGNPAALYANASYAEGKRGNGDNDTYTERLDLLSNGFKLGAASTYDIETNESGVTYIYAAFAESPFAYSRAR